MVDRQILGIAQAMGAEDVKLPDIDAELTAFREWLDSAPEIESGETEERRTLRTALGLRE